MIMIVSQTIENNLVNLRGYLWGSLVRSMIVIISWAIKNNLVNLRAIQTGSVIVILSGLLRITWSI